MKKGFALLAAALTLGLAACANGAPVAEEPRPGVIAPYALTERETELLNALGLQDRARVLDFHAPEGVRSVAVQTHRLKRDGTWETDDGSALGFETAEDQTIGDGLFAMILGENHSITFHVSHNGSRMSSKTDEILLDKEALASTTGFLESPADIVLEQEIPVALLVYDSGNEMPGASVEDYFEPSAFQGMDLVQAVTLTFSGEPL